jgi:predicted TIM-barrel fold metal-dependent hydrolase
VSDPNGGAFEAPIHDVNAMVGPIPTGPGSNCAELVATMRKFRIGRALVAHSYAWRHDPAIGNSLVIKELAQYRELRPCWVVDPWIMQQPLASEDFFAQVREAHVLAFRVYPDDHGFDLLGHDAGRMLGDLEAFGKPVLVDAAQASWSEVEEVARRHPALPLVVTQTGYRTLRAIAGALERHPEVYVDLSYLGSHAGLEWLVSNFGASRILFGSGFPHRDPADAITRLWWSELADKDVADIAGGTLRRLLERSGARDE